MAESQQTLLVIEDDPGLQSQLRWSFEGFEVVVADDRESALAQLRRVEPPVVTLDLGLPPDPGGVSEGFAVLEEILSLAPETKVIVVTGHNDKTNAVRAIGMGAYDFYEKPIDADLLNMAVQRAARVHDLERENRRYHGVVGDSPLEGLLAASPEMLKVCRTIEKLAPTDVSTLVLGESGTGKEVLVKALHKLSSRAKKKLVAINCAAIPEALLESELFGYEKGAFTGATKTTLGKIETAHGGTLMLDEIGDLPHSLQAKLLRFLQERTIERLGGRQEVPVDVRVVGATHQDLRAQIKAGQFREDLYYRLAEIVVTIPPLRERNGDAVLLAHAFLRRFAQEQRRGNLTLSEDAIRAVEAHAWPGNVRELLNAIKRAAIMADGARVTADDIGLDLPQADDSAPAASDIDLRTVREQAERQAIVTALARSNGNVVRASELLGVSRPTLYDLMRRLGIK